MIDAREQRLIDALRRSDFKAFARASFCIVAPGETLHWNWHLDAICHRLEEVLRGTVRRLIIEVPPRSLKSFLVSVAFPAFCLGRDPTRKIITASYSLELAVKHANDCRALLQSLWFRQLFPNVGKLAKNSETEFSTEKRGYRYSTSSGGTLTGRGADLLIVDDPLKSDDAHSSAKRQTLQEWFGNTLYTRLNDKVRGAIILVMQRLHIDDLAGHLRAQGGWTILSLPAIAEEPASIPVGPGKVHHRHVGDLLHPEREPRHVLDDLRATLGSFSYSAQYQQQPIPAEGAIIKWSWFNYFDELPRDSRRIVQSWDVAVKAEQIHDFSVCTTWAIVGYDYYLLDVYRDRLTFPALLTATKEHSRHWRADTIIIEDKASGSALLQQLSSERFVGVPRPIGYTPTLDKISRMSSESATIEAGQVWLKADAPWLVDLRMELTQFPNGRHDDQVDSMSQFLIWARGKSGRQAGTARIVGR